MGRIQNNQDGLGLHIIIIAIFVAAVVGFAGMRVLSKDKATKPSQSTNSTETPKTTQPEATAVPAVPTETKVEVPTVYKIPRTAYNVSYPSGWKVGSQKDGDITGDGAIDSSWTVLEGPQNWKVNFVTSYPGRGGGSCEESDIQDPNGSCAIFTRRSIKPSGIPDYDIITLHTDKPAPTRPPHPETSVFPIWDDGASNCTFIGGPKSYTDFRGERFVSIFGGACSGIIPLVDQANPQTNSPQELFVWVGYPDAAKNATDFSFEEQQGFKEAVAILASLKKE